MKYIEFRFVEQLPKTRIYEVVNIHHGNRIGLIKYYPQWRKYCLMPENGTVFSAGCLKDIFVFIENEEAIRKEKLKIRVTTLIPSERKLTS